MNAPTPQTKPPLHFSVISLFPQIFKATEYGILGQALKSKKITLSIWDLKNYVQSNKERVDDKPYGGGAGMILRYQPIRDAILAAKQKVSKTARVIYLTPQGKNFNQASALKLTKAEHLILLSGRYEGIDERLITTYVDEEWSIGDYILSGGEYAALVLIDCITRLLPGVLGNQSSIYQDSFNSDRLSHPHYTRPEIIDNQAIPAVLKKGNHQNITTWRLKQALGRTWLRRPDLLQTAKLDSTEQALLEAFISEYQASKSTVTN